LSMHYSYQSIKANNEEKIRIGILPRERNPASFKYISSLTDNTMASDSE